MADKLQSNRPEMTLALATALSQRGKVPSLELLDDLQPTLDQMGLNDTPYSNWRRPHAQPVTTNAAAVQQSATWLTPGAQVIAQARKLVVSCAVAVQLQLWHVTQATLAGSFLNDGTFSAKPLRQLIPGQAMSDWPQVGYSKVSIGRAVAGFGGNLLGTFNLQANIDRELIVDISQYGHGGSDAAAPLHNQSLLAVLIQQNQAFSCNWFFDEWPLAR